MFRVMKVFKSLLLVALACSSVLYAKQEQTLSIIKPDAVKSQHIGEILARFEQNEIKIIGLKMKKLSKKEAKGFYAVHKDRPFYKDLVEFMTSGPVVISVLEGEGVIEKNRKLMGSTDPQKAEKGTLRADFATNVQANAVHGSDSPETAQKEIAYFFKPNELFPKE